MISYQSKLILIPLLLIFTACGKSPTQNDRVKDSLKETVLEKETALAPLVGKYEGTLTSPNGKDVQKIAFQLISTIMIIQNPGRNDVTEMPTLGGNINIYFNPDDPSDVLPIAQFTNSMYDTGNGHLRMNGNIQTGTSIGNVINTFEGFVVGRKIRGELSNTSRGYLGIVEVEKITQ